MNRRSLWLLSLSLTAAGCTCGAFDPATTRFACSTDDDCGAGYVCAPANGAKECVLASTAGGGGGGSVTGGGGGGGVTGGGGAAGGGGGTTGGGGGDVDAGDDGGMDAGADSGVDAGADAGTDGGTRDGGTDAGPGAPDHLVITTPPQTLPTGVCSNALNVEMRDALDRPTTSPASLQLSLSSSLPLVSFFTVPTCVGSVSQTTIPAGASATTLYFRGQQPGNAVLTIASLTLRPGQVSQTEVISGPPAALAFVTPAPVTPAAGFCFQATVEARSTLGAPVNVATNTTINLQSTPADGLRFFSDAACATSVTATTMPGGQSRASFYVKTITGGADTLMAIAPFGTASQQLQVTGVVRRGTCNIGSAQTSFNCVITPPQSSLATTMVVYQATVGNSLGAAPGEYEVRCRLTSVDTLTCERPSAGTQAIVSWQTAELETGLQVSRGASSSCPPPLAGLRTLPVIPPADPTSSFVLSSFSGTGTNFDGDDLSAMRLAPDAGFVFLDNRDFAAAGCTGYEYQVVQLDGVTSLRGSSGAMAQGQRQVTVANLPPAALNTTVLLNQAVMSANPPLSLSMCNFLVRASMPSPTSLLFSRGADQINPLNCSDVAISDVAWERVDFGARAQVQPFTMTMSNSSTTVNIAAVDVTRTLIFAGGQMAGGQSSGETAMDNAGDDTIGSAQARFDLMGPTSVRVTRATGNSTGMITFYVVELEP